MFVDSFGRRPSYLRLSLTQRCNFGCVYCVPREGLPTVLDRLALTREEILRLVSLVVPRGINKVRLTGGEPLLRRDVVDIVRGLKRITGLNDLSLTTNGSLLAALVKPLQAAGLDRVNISLDRLNPKRFTEITGSQLYERVLAGAFAALQAGLRVKLNMVVLRDLCERDICDFVDLALRYPIEVRFLEFMPLCGEAWDTQSFWPIHEVRRMVKEKFLLSKELPRGDEVAQTFKLLKGQGSVGFIGSVSESFCENCTRLRLTVDGNIRPCLFSDLEFPLGSLLKNQATDAEILAVVETAIAQKPRGNQFFETPFDGVGSVPAVASATPLIHHIGG